MDAGIKTVNLPSSDTLDDVIAIKSIDGIDKTRRVRVDKLSVQLAATGALATIQNQLKEDIDRVEGTANTSTYTVQTHAQLLAITPDAETNGGVVLNDPDPNKNGYYYRDSAEWQWGRGFNASLVEVILTGTANAQIGTIVGSPNLSSTLMYYGEVATINTDALTLAIAGLNGGAALDVKNIAGSDHAAGQWTGHIMFVNKTTHYQVINAPDGLGIPGAQGVAGDQGAQGTQGVQGDQGIQGPAGPTGSGTGDMIAANNLSEVEAGPAKNNLEIGEIDNTSDADKPVSTAQASALATKQPISSLAADLAALISGLTDAGALAGTEQLLLGNGQRTTLQEIADMAPSGGGSGANDAIFAMQFAILQGQQIGMTAAVSDPFDDEDDVDTAASLNQLYDSGNNQYKPTSTGVVETTAVATEFTGAGYTMFNRSLVVTNDQTVTRIGFSSAIAQSGVMKIAKRNSAGNYDIVVSFSVSHSGGSIFEDFELPAAFVVPSSGDYFIGVYTAGHKGRLSGQAIGYKTGDITGVGQTGFIEAAGAAGVAVSVTYDGSLNNMTVVSEAFTALVEPDVVHLVVQVIENEAVAANTDFTGEVSRDDGVTWATAVLDLAWDLGSYKLYSDPNIDISGHPNGDQMRWRFKTFNNKNVPLGGATEQWGN